MAVEPKPDLECAEDEGAAREYDEKIDERGLQGIGESVERVAKDLEARGELLATSG
jgi:hypothetical protein